MIEPGSPVSSLASGSHNTGLKVLGSVVTLGWIQRIFILCVLYVGDNMENKFGAWALTKAIYGVISFY